MKPCVFPRETPVKLLTNPEKTFNPFLPKILHVKKIQSSIQVITLICTIQNNLTNIDRQTHILTQPQL